MLSQIGIILYFRAMLDPNTVFVKVTTGQNQAKLPSPKYFVTVQQCLANLMTQSHVLLQCNAGFNNFLALFSDQIITDQTFD